MLYGVVFVRCVGCGVCGMVCGMCDVYCRVWYMCVCGVVCVMCDVCFMVWCVCVWCGVLYVLCIL